MALLPRRCFAVALGIAMAACASRAVAQEQLAPLTDIEQAHSKYYTLLEKFKSGQQQPTAADGEALKAEARWLLYRFTVSNPPLKAGDIAKLQKDFTYFVDRVMDPLHRKNNANGVFIQQFSPVLVKHFKDVLDRDFLENRFAIVNTAPMLVQAARMKDPALADYLVAILADGGAAKANAAAAEKKDEKKSEAKAAPKYHDVIKLYAARALREFLPVAAVDEADVIGNNLTKAQLARKDREVRYIDALNRYIALKSAASDKLSAPEQEALRFLRRDAVESLAAAKAPAVMLGKTGVEAPVAPTLLRVLAPKSGMQPSPDLHERFEAAIGVCQIDYRKVPEYDPEIGLYLVSVLINDLATEYNRDLAAIKGDKRKQPYMHWRMNSKRLELALKDLAANAKGSPIASQANTLAMTATTLIKNMQSTQLNQIEAPDLTTFRKLVSTLRPKSREVYKNLKGFTIEIE